MNRLVTLTLVAGVISLGGCSSEERGGPRIPTYPVTGTVYVDGTPVPGVQVTCTPMSEGEIQYQLATTTDEDGNFSIGVYEAGDGLPVGKYALTFVWTEGITLGTPKDKLKGRYFDPKKSEVQFDVTAGDPTELDIINLASK